MKPTPEQIAAAVHAMDSGLIKFFPADEKSRAAIMFELERMIPSIEALRWLTDTYVRRIGEWHSLKELRAVMCSKFPPLDGLRVPSAIPGFTPAEVEAEIENASRIAHQHQWDGYIAEGQRQIAASEDPEFEAKWNRENEEIQKRISDAAIERSIDKSKKRIPYRAPEWLENL